jgi:hypothetical protein
MECSLLAGHVDKRGTLLQSYLTKFCFDDRMLFSKLFYQLRENYGKLWLPFTTDFGDRINHFV